ncbi:hypothetical protein HOLleu_40403 [Holothuria leucospilota]|uniref:Uncharacterized protein n=1 Tax=Holothuria leucospilota TaxID=206669 RepID=A0A9Q1BCU4_HOLLE|nr:hypothetical protein HOLleu_40403 [Holothuria leucospilota]
MKRLRLNILAKEEEAFPTKEGSKAKSKPSICGTTSSKKLAETIRENELLEQTKLLQERKTLEKRTKLLELELQHQAETHVIQAQLVESKGRCQVLEEISDGENSQCLDDAYLESTSARSKRGDCVPLKQHEVRPKVADALYQGQQLEQHENIKMGVEELCSDDKRIASLEQYTVGDAHKIVVGFSYLDAKVGYPAAMAELKRRYGDPVVIANSYIKKVMSWPTIKADNLQALDEFALFLKKCEAATRSSCVGGLGVLEFSENLKRILQKTPYFMHDKLRTVVQRLRKNETTIGFSNLVEFIRAESIKQNDPMYGRSNLTSDKKHRQDGKAKFAPEPVLRVRVYNVGIVVNPTSLLNAPRLRI